MNTRRVRTWCSMSLHILGLTSDAKDAGGRASCSITPISIQQQQQQQQQQQGHTYNQCELQ